MSFHLEAIILIWWYDVGLTTSLNIWFNIALWTKNVSRVFLRSTWNLLRSTIHELKLRTFLSLINVCPSKRKDHSLSHGVASDFSSILCIELVLGFWFDKPETYSDEPYLSWTCAHPIFHQYIRPSVGAVVT